MRIYLIGFMGCGKSTLGRKVAKLLDLNFIDLDKYIEERYFKTISLIFSEEGEKGFREKERHSLHEVSQFENVVIGTGGGTPCFFNNMEVMNLSGFTVYLAPETETLVNRIYKSKNERPLVSGKSKEELVTYIEHALEKRIPFYEQAAIIIRGVNNLKPEVVIQEINKLN